MIAGFANDVEAVNQLAAPIQAALAAQAIDEGIVSLDAQSLTLARTGAISLGKVFRAKLD